MKTIFLLLLAAAGSSVAAQNACNTTFYGDGAVAGYNEDVDGPWVVRAADFDGDGHPDLVVASQYEGTILFRHGGSEGGGFQYPVVISPDPVRHLVVGDVNGDGKADVVLSQYYGNQITTLLGNGDGSFAAKTFSIPEPWDVALADMNHDGKLDLIVTTADTNLLSIYPGNGDGTWGAPSNTAIPSYTNSIAVADVDGDGRPDIMTAHSVPSQIDIWHGNGDGTVSAASPLAAGPFPVALTAVDLDGDGRLDLVCGNTSSPAISLYHNMGGGSFDAPVVRALPATAPGALSGLNAVPRGIAVGDFLGKGRRDLAVAGPQWVSIFPANGDGTFADPAAFITPLLSLTDLIALDLNGDGALDFAMTSGNYGGGVAFLTHKCGTTSLFVTSQYPVVSSGQSAQVSVLVAGHNATGTVSLREGGTSVASVTTSDPKVNLSAILPAGTHTLTVHYDGDFWNEPSSSAPFTIQVTDATTTTTANTIPGTVTFGDPVAIHPSVTSSTGDNPGGQYHVTVDGNSDPGFGPLSPTFLTNTTNVLMPAGTHTLLVSYDGDATHPPSSAAPITIVVNKKTPQLDATSIAPASPKEGQAITVTLSASVAVTVSTHGNGAPTGTVEVRSDGHLLGTTSFNGLSTYSFPQAAYLTLRPLSIGWLPAGTHVLTINYWGDANYTPAVKTVSVAVAAGTPPPPKHRAAPHS